MATLSGIFTLPEFENREALKLAPDAFVSINGALGARVISPVEKEGTKGLDIRGGITTINVNSSLRPAGSSRATIEIIAPQYKGLHDDYYVTLPNGTKIPYFVAMQEVKIFMKGRYLRAYDKHPVYYPVFWGLITEVTENYSGGVNTFSLTCQDLLVWWKYQKITLKPSAWNTLYGSPTFNHFSTVFENMSAWEVIYALFSDTYFIQKRDEENIAGTYNFVYPKFSKAGFAPDFGDMEKIEDIFGGLARDTQAYWNKRFAFDGQGDPSDPGRVPLEMYGMRGKLDLTDIKNDVFMSSVERDKRRAEQKVKIDLDYGMLADVQPYGPYSLFGDSSESLEQTKLDIANQICEQLNFEFFLDTNGSFVFKPPFYNLIVNTENTPEYVVDPKDIINFNSSVNSDNIVNYLEVTAPIYQSLDNLEVIGYHIDWESVKKYGIRYQSLALRYGFNAKTLRLTAAAEMSRINTAAFTGSCSIPLRPEIRLGYPVYIKHIDAYYYVTAINHSFTIGSGATTDLSLEAKRDRVFDDGSITKQAGTCLKAYIYNFRDTPIINSETDNVDEKLAQLEKAMQTSSLSQNELADMQMLIEKDNLKRQNNILAGPKSTGFYELKKASMEYRNIEYDPPSDVEKRLSEDAKALVKNKDLLKKFSVLSNELVMITDHSAPFTDMYGYRHIGSFPYGANLLLLKNGDMSDLLNRSDLINNAVDSITNMTPNEATAGSDGKASSTEPAVPNKSNPATTEKEQTENAADSDKQAQDKKTESTTSGQPQPKSANPKSNTPSGAADTESRTSNYMRMRP